jgi:hypothetical protein
MKFVCEKILSAATPVAYNPATLQGKRRLKKPAADGGTLIGNI